MWLWNNHARSQNWLVLPGRWFHITTQGPENQLAIPEWWCHTIAPGPEVWWVSYCHPVCFLAGSLSWLPPSVGFSPQFLSGADSTGMYGGTLSLVLCPHTPDLSVLNGIAKKYAEILKHNLRSIWSLKAKDPRKLTFTFIDILIYLIQYTNNNTVHIL